MNKLLKFGVVSLSLATLGVTTQVLDLPVLSPLTVHANENTEPQPANLDVPLGASSHSGETVTATVTLEQDQVKTDALAAIKDLRGQMWDLNPPLVPYGETGHSTLKETAARYGLTTKEAYVDAIKWDSELEKVAIQRVAEQLIRTGHTRPDGSGLFNSLGGLINAENLANGYTTTDAITNAWGHEELEELHQANGLRNANNGHLHSQINPAMKYFAVAKAGSRHAEVLSIRVTGSETGSGLTGNYTLPIKISPEQATNVTITLDKEEYVVGETVKPTASSNGLALTPTISDTNIVGNDFIAKAPGTVTFSIAGKTVSATVVDRTLPNIDDVTPQPPKAYKYNFIVEGVNENSVNGVANITAGEILTFPNWDPNRYEVIEGRTTLNYDDVVDGETYTLKVRKKQQTTDQQPPSPNTGTVTLRPKKRIRYSFILEGVNDTNPAEGSTYLSEGNTMTFPNWDPSYYELIEGETTLSYDRVTEGELYVLKVRKKQQTTDQQPPQADKKIHVTYDYAGRGSGVDIILKPGETKTVFTESHVLSGWEYASGPKTLSYDDVVDGGRYIIHYREKAKPDDTTTSPTLPDKKIRVINDYAGRGGGGFITIKPGETKVLYDEKTAFSGWEYASGPKTISYDEAVDGKDYIIYHREKPKVETPDKDTPKPDTNQPDSTKPDANKPNPGTPVGYLPGKEKDSFIQPVTQTPPSTTPQNGVTGSVGSQKPVATSSNKDGQTSNQVAPTASKPATASNGSASVNTNKDNRTLPKTSDAQSSFILALGAGLTLASLGLLVTRQQKD